MSFGGAYASGLLSTDVIVSPCSLFGYCSTGKWSWPCFSSYCAAWNGYEEPGERLECMCHYISKNIPLKMVALKFCTGISGCLPFEECFEIVLQRQGGRELLLSPEYIVRQLVESFGDDIVDMAACYSQFGLRPCVTMADIDRYYDDGEGVYEPRYLRSRRLLLEDLAKFMKAIQVARPSNVKGASVQL